MVSLISVPVTFIFGTTHLVKASACLQMKYQNLSLICTDGSAARREDFEAIQQELGLAQHKFLKHVESRWLSLPPTVVRAFEQFQAQEKYFLLELPRKQRSMTSSARYIRIESQLMSKDTVAKVHFLLSVGGIFEPFLKFFQSEEPLIHLPNSKFSLLLRLLVG